VTLPDGVGVLLAFVDAAGAVLVGANARAPAF
jgi:hypothetical protein